MNRRNFIAGLGGAAAWPLAARAQQRERMRRIGVLFGAVSDDPAWTVRFAGFLQGLRDFGWAVGRNIQIDIRWAGGDDDRARKFAMELVALAPDVILAGDGFSARFLKLATTTVPIVFTGLNDPVGAGIVASLARPGANVTGFALIEYGTSAKLLDLLKQVAPHVKRAAVIRTLRGGLGHFGAIQAAAPSFGVEVRPIDPSDAGEMEREIVAFARDPNGGLIVPSSLLANVHSETIISLAARYHLPAVYNERSYVTKGGLVSYGPVNVDEFRRAAGYVDRILKGEKPADLPVQAPTKYETVINQRTARVLGLKIPAQLVAPADEVIE